MAFRPSSLLLVSIPIVFFSVISVSEETSSPSLMSEIGTSSELQELKLKLVELESALEVGADMLNNRVKRLQQNQLLVEEMELNIQHLQEHLYVTKKSASSLPSGRSISDLEEEMQHLWAESRKNNFDLHTLESEAHDAEKRLTTLTSKVQKVESIVAEQWIQFRQVEQALQTTKMRTLKARKEFTKTFLESVRNWCKHFFPRVMDILYFCFSKDNISIARSYLSRTSDHLKKFLSVIRVYHHKLQNYVKQTLESSETTANLANNEFIFFLASAMIVFPITVAILLVIDSRYKSEP